MPYADNDGVRIYYEDEGSGPPLLLHIGFMARLQDWRRAEVAVTQGLRADYRLLLMDPRGQGQSDKPCAAVAYTLARRVGDVTAVLDAAGIDRAYYWGYSLGGQVGFGLAAYVPDRCRALILGGASPYGPDAAGSPRTAASHRRCARCG